MKYAMIDPFEVVNGVDVGVSLYTQGCNKRCIGCFNQSAWDMDGGKDYTKDIEERIITMCGRPGIKRFTILGGEPLLDRNKEDLINLCINLKDKYPDLIIWLYTGNIYEDIKEEWKDLLIYVDVLVDGPFEIDKKDLTLPFRGSNNQRIIYLNKERT